jgi:hypothetical protein
MSTLPAAKSPRAPSADTTIDHQIRRRIEENIHYYVLHLEEIDTRLAELDHE